MDVVMFWDIAPCSPCTKYTEYIPEDGNTQIFFTSLNINRIENCFKLKFEVLMKTQAPPALS
jgi:hypothetical protein